MIFFFFLVTAFEEAKDISKLTLEELSSFLLAHEPRVLIYCERPKDKALFMKWKSSIGENWSSSCGRGRGYSRGKGRNLSRGRGRVYVPRSEVNVRDTKTT